MDTNSKSSNNTAVILVSHGSTLPFAEEVFEEIKEKFIKKSDIAAEIGYMKVSEPTIAGAVEILKEEVDDLDKIKRIFFSSFEYFLHFLKHFLTKR